MYDTHVHSYYSMDSESSFADITKRAQEAGRDKIYITDHMDYVLGQSRYYFDVLEYSREIDWWNAQQNQIQYLKAIELGFDAHSLPEIRNILNLVPFDMILLSVHQISSVSLSHLASKTETAEEEVELLGMALDATYHALHMFDDFDTLAHLDFVSRYLPQKSRMLPYYEKKMKDILNLLITKQKSLEINTKSLALGMNEFHPQTSVVELYYRLGGRKLTMGSDAHSAEDMYQYFDLATKQLKNIGFDYVEYYIGRQAYQQKL